MAARQLRALAGAALGPPRPTSLRAGAGVPRPLGLALCSAAGRPPPGGPEGAPRRPAGRELTPAERRIAQLHAAACAVSPSSPARVLRRARAPRLPALRP